MGRRDTLLLTRQELGGDERLAGGRRLVTPEIRPGGVGGGQLAVAVVVAQAAEGEQAQVAVVGGLGGGDAGGADPDALAAVGAGGVERDAVGGREPAVAVAVDLHDLPQDEVDAGGVAVVEREGVAGDEARGVGVGQQRGGGFVFKVAEEDVVPVRRLISGGGGRRAGDRGGALPLEEAFRAFDGVRNEKRGRAGDADRCAEGGAAVFDRAVGVDVGDHVRAAGAFVQRRVAANEQEGRGRDEGNRTWSARLEHAER